MVIIRFLFQFFASQHRPTERQQVRFAHISHKSVRWTVCNREESRFLSSNCCPLFNTHSNCIQNSWLFVHLTYASCPINIKLYFRCSACSCIHFEKMCIICSFTNHIHRMRAHSQLVVTRVPIEFYELCAKNAQHIFKLACALRIWPSAEHRAP